MAATRLLYKFICSLSLLIATSCAAIEVSDRVVAGQWFCSKQWIYSIVEADKHSDKSGKHAISVGLKTGQCFAFPIPIPVSVVDVLGSYKDSKGKAVEILGVVPKVDKEVEKEVYPVQYIIVPKNVRGTEV